MDNARAEQVQQLEALLESYKSTNLHLTQQLEETVGREPVSVTATRIQELEAERTAKVAVQEGSLSPSFALLNAYCSSVI